MTVDELLDMPGAEDAHEMGCEARNTNKAREVPSEITSDYLICAWLLGWDDINTCINFQQQT